MTRWLVPLLCCAACGDSPVAVCAGNHAGTFDGSDMGTIDGTLDEKGKAELTFDSEASGALTGNGTVDDDGTISLSGLGMVISGDLDLSSCDSSGTWDQNVLGLSGTWTMSQQ